MPDASLRTLPPMVVRRPVGTDRWMEGDDAMVQKGGRNM